MAIILGVPLLVLFIVLVAGIPLAYALKRDQRYQATQGQPESNRLKVWYQQ